MPRKMEEPTHRFFLQKSYPLWRNVNKPNAFFQPPESQRCDDKTVPEERKNKKGGSSSGLNHYFECVSGVH